jgi:hypothetical protein
MGWESYCSLVGDQLTSVWHLLPLKVLFNTDASALAVPAIVLIVQRSHESDPNDRNRISSKMDAYFRQKLSAGSAEGRWQDKAGFPASGTSFLSVCLHIVFGSISDVPSR